MELSKKIYFLFFIGIAIGVITSLTMIYLLFPISREGNRNNPQQETATHSPIFGEKGYDPEKSGYQALIGTVKSADIDEIILSSQWCIKGTCDPNKKYEYHAKIARGTILKRLTKKSEASFAAEIKNRKDKNTPPNPYREEPLQIETLKIGENVTVLVEEIINENTFVAHEIRIFEPLVSVGQ